MKIQAFSLIELLVVITIIGVLAAVAVPVYENYSIATKISAGKQIVDSVINQSTVGYGTTGTFTAVNYPNVGNTYAFPPYVYSISSAADNDFSCPGYSYRSDISNIASGAAYPAANSAVISYNVNIFDVNGVLQSFCSYQYRNSSGVTVTTTIDGMEGCYNIATTQGNADFISAQAAVANQCQ